MNAVTRYPIKCADALVDRIVAVVSAVAGSQFPAFVQHYTQRLGGHVAEAERNLMGWKAIAQETTGGDLVGLANRYLLSVDPEVVAAGNKCSTDIARADTLRDALASLQHATVWERPFVFLLHVDHEIASATLDEFSMNVPLDLEGLLYAACGLIFGILLYMGAKHTCLLPKRRRLRKRALN